MTEMFTDESHTQALMFLHRVFLKESATAQRSRYLGYDRCCSFKPFLRNLTAKGNAEAKMLLENVEFLIDIFHVEKHTKPDCMPLKDNPQGEYQSPSSSEV